MYFYYMQSGRDPANLRTFSQPQLQLRRLEDPSVILMVSYWKLCYLTAAKIQQSAFHPCYQHMANAKEEKIKNMECFGKRKEEN